MSFYICHAERLAQRQRLLLRQRRLQLQPRVRLQRQRPHLQRHRHLLQGLARPQGLGLLLRLALSADSQVIGER